MEAMLSLLWTAGTMTCALLLIGGAWLVLDFHFHASVKFERLLAQLALYESLVRAEFVAAAKEEVLEVMAGSLRPGVIPLRRR